MARTSRAAATRLIATVSISVVGLTVAAPASAERPSALAANPDHPPEPCGAGSAR